MSMQTPDQTSEQPTSESATDNLPQTYPDPTTNGVQQPPNSIPPYQPPPEQLVPTKYVVIGIITAVVISIVSIAFIMYMAANYAYEMAALRDIMIIALALESCIFGIALLATVALWHLGGFGGMVHEVRQGEVPPGLRSAPSQPQVREADGELSPAGLCKELRGSPSASDAVHQRGLLQLDQTVPLGKRIRRRRRELN